MQTFTIISLIVNFGLLILVLSLVFPKVNKRYRERKKLRETQEVKRIQKIVIDYLQQLQQ